MWRDEDGASSRMRGGGGGGAGAGEGGGEGGVWLLGLVEAQRGWGEARKALNMRRDARLQLTRLVCGAELW